VVKLTRWALSYVDASVVEEVLAYVATLDDKPRTVKYLATTIRRWAAERGVDMPEFGS